MISSDLFKQIRRIHIRSNRQVNSLFAGSYCSAFKGVGLEFEDVREYQAGDEVRNIDWNVTARLQTPYVKNFREERELTVMLLVDVSASSHFASSYKQKKELIAEIGAVLAFSAIKNNDKVGLILFSSDVEYYLPPKKGVKHVLRVIRELLVFKPKKKGTDLEKALSFLGKIQKKQGICFVISDFISSMSKKTFSLTAKRHDLISICITDPLEWDLPNVGLVEMCDLETGVQKLIDTSSRGIRRQFNDHMQNRVFYIKKLMNRIGAGFISIKTNEDFVTIIKHFFSLRRKL